MKDDKLGNWDQDVWDESISSKIKMVIMDYKNILGIINKNQMKDYQYYENFLTLLNKVADLATIDPKMWL